MSASPPALTTSPITIRRIKTRAVAVLSMLGAAGFLFLAVLLARAPSPPIDTSGTHVADGTPRKDKEKDKRPPPPPRKDKSKDKPEKPKVNPTWDRVTPARPADLLLSSECADAAIDSDAYDWKCRPVPDAPDEEHEEWERRFKP